MYQSFQDYLDYLSDAAATVLTWEIPEDGFADAVKAHACLMAGINPDDLLWHYAD